MPEPIQKHINQWLSAYSDGELQGAIFQQVQGHLETCTSCREELALLRSLSNVLHRDAQTGDFLSTERFVSNLTLNLPRQPEKPETYKALEIGWWLIPLGVLGVWAFLLATFSLSGWVLGAANSGLLNGNLAWLSTNPPQTEWFTWLNNVFGSQLGLTGQTLLRWLNDADLYIGEVFRQVLLQALLGCIYLGWLASWWLKRPETLSNPEGMNLTAQ